MRKIARISLVAAFVVSLIAMPVNADLLKDGGFEVNAFDESINVGAPYYTGLGIDGDIVANSTITMYMPLSYNGSEEKSFTAVTTIIDNDNTVKYISYDTFSDDDTELTLQITPAESFAKGEYTIKTYLWDKMDFTRLYCEDFGYSYGNNADMRTSAWTIGNAFVPTSGEKAEGLTSLMLNSVADSESETSQIVRAKKDMLYRLDFAAMGNSYFGYDVTDETGNSLIGGKQQFSGAVEWTYPSQAMFTLDADKNIKTVFYDSDVSGVSYIDDVAITTNLVANGSLEYGDDGYSFEDGSYITNEAASDGEYSVKLTKSSFGRDICLLGNEFYNVSAELMGDTCYLTVKDPQGDVIAHKYLSSGEDFGNLGFEFYAPEDGIYTIEAITAGTAYADNISLCQTDKNLITDADISENFADSWKIRSETNENTIITRIKGAESEYGLMLSGRPKYYTGLSQSVLEKLNLYGVGKYKISGYVRYGSQAGGGTVNAKIMAMRGVAKDGTVDKVIATSITGVTTDWMYFEKELDIDNFGVDAAGNVLTKCSDGHNMNGILYFETPNGDTNDICISDVRLEAMFDRTEYPEYDEFVEPEIEYWSKNLLENGDFETNSADPWKMRGNKAGVTTTLGPVSGGADGSSYALKLSGRPYYYTGVYQLIRDALNTHGTGEYKISGYARFDDSSSDSQSISLKIQPQAKNTSAGINSALIYFANVNGISNEWTYFETTINVESLGKDSSGNELAQCTTGNQDGIFYIETLSSQAIRDNLCLDNLKIVRKVDKDHPDVDLNQ